MMKLTKFALLKTKRKLINTIIFIVVILSIKQRIRINRCSVVFSSKTSLYIYNYTGIHFKDPIFLLPKKKVLVDVEMGER